MLIYFADEGTGTPERSLLSGHARKRVGNIWKVLSMVSLACDECSGHQLMIFSLSLDFRFGAK